MEEAIRDALIKGWLVTSQHPRQAVFSYPGRRGMSDTENLAHFALSMLTLGLWLPVWAIMAAMSANAVHGAQTLIITDTGTEITQKVITT